MTTTTRQPKGIPVGGQFAATTHTEPGIVLSGGQAEFVNDRHLFQRELEANAGPNVVLEEKDPSTKSEARRLLKNSRGEEGGRVRLVNLDYTNSPDTEPGKRIDVVGPKDGRPIIVDVTSGLPSLKVTSGKAIVRLRSGWGNALDVGPGAAAVIIAPATPPPSASTERQKPTKEPKPEKPENGPISKRCYCGPVQMPKGRQRAVLGSPAALFSRRTFPGAAKGGKNHSPMQEFIHAFWHACIIFRRQIYVQDPKPQECKHA